MTSVLVGKDSLAYNTAGFPYDHHVEKKFEGYILRARGIDAALLDGNPTYFTTRTSLAPNQDGGTGIACIWVGMIPRSAKNYTAKNAAPGALPKKGLSINQIENSTVIQHDEYALKVVVVLAHSQNKFYVLLDDEEDLPECRRVELDNVFFFAKFRDDAVTAREKRAEVWSKNIRDFRGTVNDQRPQQQKKALAHASQITVQKKVNFENHLKGLLASYVRDPRESYLEIMRQLVRREDTDLAHRPLGCEAIISLIDSKTVVPLEVAVKAVDEVKTLWTALQEMNIKPEELVSMSKGLIEGGITLEYSLIRVFVVGWVQTIRTGDIGEDKDLGNLAKQSLRFSQLACGGDAPVPPLVHVQDNEFISFLDTTIENLRVLVLYSEQYTDAITESIGHDFSGESLADIFARFSLTPDVEGAEQWIREACHYLIVELVHRDEGVVKYLRELIGSLEEFRTNLFEVSDAMETGT